MHYGDKEQLKAHKLIIVIYKHGVFEDNEKDSKNYDLQICSIVEARHISIFYLERLNKLVNILLKKNFKKLKNEKYYLVEMRFDKDHNWNLVKCKQITDKEIKKNPLLGLH